MADTPARALAGLRRRALIDLDALAANLAGTRLLDARANAYGHGLHHVAALAFELGIRAIRVSDDADAAIARGIGFSDVVVGRAPADAGDETPYGLDEGASRPVLTVAGELVAVKRVPTGSGVSYGYTHRTVAPTSLGLVGLGYADGIPRLASNRAELSIDGTRYPLVGRVAMDQLVIDLGDDSPPTGAPVVAFGDPARGEPAARAWAAWTEREPLALTAGLGDRIRRETR